MCSAGKLPIGDHGLAEDVVTPRGPVADSELGAVQHESQRFSASCGVQANGGPVKMKFTGGSLLFHVLCEPRSTTVVLKTWEIGSTSMAWRTSSGFAGEGQAWMIEKDRGFSAKELNGASYFPRSRISCHALNIVYR